MGARPLVEGGGKEGHLEDLVARLKKVEANQEGVQGEGAMQDPSPYPDNPRHLHPPSTDHGSPGHVSNFSTLKQKKNKNQQKFANLQKLKFLFQN